MVFSLLLVACNRHSNKSNDSEDKRSISHLGVRINELEKKQQLLIERQEKNQKEILKEIKEIKPGLVKLKELYNYEKEKELVETPIEKTKKAISEIRMLAAAVQAFFTDSEAFPGQAVNSPYKLNDLQLCRVQEIRGQISSDTISNIFQY